MTDPVATQTVFFALLAELMLTDNPRVRLLGHQTQAAHFVRARAHRTSDSVWNQQLSATVRDVREGMTTYTQAHQVPLPRDRDLVTEGLIASNPLSASVCPQARVGAIVAPMLITDSVHAFVSGPDGTQLAGTVWETTDEDLLRRGVEVFEAAWAVARPVSQMVDRALLSGRRLETAMLLAEGRSDQEIAEALDVSPRTVSTEVRAVTDWLGDRDRAHAVSTLNHGAR
ncbi:helix-turn-helix transcriptional regulator [Phycicoccus sp. CSK15P-2]|uniref:helix-turn-helix transcriptional regulator n=1 Tax=Phycicoccus sp. CSK15P-2 TaxID=2807627 RepID=UPI001951A079|nr:helix-turn-helix transcriptional regulator [Phycicoccus sp. CSK15P-2]MBM6403589.1 helix-turn-helix transcriptional regulator [Phycicoccus sp. CSK15P-2]MBM6405054.1 helix-turn-helix transcriptional regulator [Phycicoccus sp. CSK15P-2]